VNTISKITRELEKITTEKEWQEVFLFSNIAHDNFRRGQLEMQKNIRKAEERQKNEALKAQWRDGERVSFYSVRFRERCLGVITKRNPKRARVQVYVGTCNGEWSVPYRHLNKMVDINEIKQLTIGKMSR